LNRNFANGEQDIGTDTVYLPLPDLSCRALFARLKERDPVSIHPHNCFSHHQILHSTHYQKSLSSSLIHSPVCLNILNIPDHSTKRILPAFLSPVKSKSFPCGIYCVSSSADSTDAMRESSDSMMPLYCLRRDITGTNQQ